MYAVRQLGFWLNVLRYHRLWLVVALALAVLALPGFVRLESDNSPSVFFVRGSESVERFHRFADSFDSDETLRVVLEGPGLWTPEAVRWWGSLEDRIAEVPGVVRVTGLHEHYRRFGWPPADVDAFRQQALANPLDRGVGSISADGSIVTILVQIPDSSQAPSAATLEALERLLAEAPTGVEVRCAGLPALNHELDRSSAEIARLYFPLLILFTLALLAWVVRRPVEIAIVIGFVAFCQLMVLGIMGYVGARLNLVLAVLPPLVFVISLATALHLLLRFRHLCSDEPTEPGRGREKLEARRASLAAASMMAEKGWAVFWTGVTTVVGFASLAASPVAPVRSLGLWAGLALALATWAALVFLPSALVLVQRDGPSPGDGFEERVARMGERWARWARQRRLGVLAVALTVTGLALLGLPQIRVESNALRYLAADHPLRTTVARLEASGIGVAAVELLVTLPDREGGAPPPFGSAIEVDRLADLGATLEQEPGIFGVVNAGVVLRDAARYVPSTPMNAHMRQQMVLDGLRQDAQGRGVLDALLSDNRRIARSTAFVATQGADELEVLRHRIEELATLEFPEAEVETTGQYPLLLEAQQFLISTLVIALALTFGVVALVLRWILPSNRLAFLALVPNLWPVIGALGFMGWVGMPLDIATVMMASVVLGLAVDDTIHTLGHFRALAPEHGRAVAIDRTLRATAPAYLLTGLILVAGFGVCGLSDFAPIARFGGLSALGIGLAVLGDLFLVPALLALVPEEVCNRLK